MTEGKLLERIAATLRRDIGPAVAEEYPKTQAFMAAVVLQKLGRQIDLAEVHRDADSAAMNALQDDLRMLLASGSGSSNLQAAVDALAEARDAEALCSLITLLYAERDQLGAACAETVLARVRLTLRASIDRRMEYAA